MPRLLQHRLDPASRLVRLMCAEYGVPLDLEDIRPWRRDTALLEINPAATGCIFVDEGEELVGRKEGLGGTLTPALSRTRERELKTPLSDARALPPLPRAGEGWGEGGRQGKSA